MKNLSNKGILSIAEQHQRIKFKLRKTLSVRREQIT